jgi:probable rRNA maturation factor
MSVERRAVEVAVEGVAAPGLRTPLKGFCARALRSAGMTQWEVSILLCGDDRIRDLNGRYRGKARPTDVLSFPADVAEGEGIVAGDIAISLPTMRRNAAAYGVPESEELKRLLVHGLLHLAGMEHGRGKGRKMLALQERLLARLQAERIIRE